MKLTTTLHDKRIWLSNEDIKVGNEVWMLGDFFISDVTVAASGEFDPVRYGERHLWLDSIRWENLTYYQPQLVTAVTVVGENWSPEVRTTSALGPMECFFKLIPDPTVTCTAGRPTGGGGRRRRRWKSRTITRAWQDAKKREPHNPVLQKAYATNICTQGLARKRLPIVFFK